MRRSVLVLTALLAATAVTAPALAAGNRVNVPRKFKKVLSKAKADSGIAVRLPTHLRVDVKPRRVVGKLVTAKAGKYELDLGIGKDCNGSSACAVAFFFGERGA